MGQRHACTGVQADAGTRTPDPFITSEVLYQLSYVGAGPDASAAPGLRGASLRPDPSAAGSAH
jgi:hypothetical protein